MNQSGYNGESERIKVLLYHRLISESDSEDWANIAVRESIFLHQIELLHRWGYASITFRDYEMFLKGELNLPRKPVIITFDDAYEEIYSVAMPILQKFGMTAVIFTIGDFSIRESIWDKGKGETFKLLDKKQLVELHSAGCEIGSHSLTHPRLPSNSTR